MGSSSPSVFVLSPVQGKNLVAFITASSPFGHLVFSVLTHWSIQTFAFTFSKSFCIWALSRAIRQRAPVCSVLGKTYWNECLLHKEACRKKRRTGLAHAGPCLGKHTEYQIFHTISTMRCRLPAELCYHSWSVSKAECSEEELGQFPYRLLDWFLLLSRMEESYAPAAPPQSCLSHAQRAQLAQVAQTWRRDKRESHGHTLCSAKTSANDAYEINIHNKM